MRPSTLVKAIGVLGVKAAESCAANPLTTAKQESVTLGKSRLDIRFLMLLPPAADTISSCRPERISRNLGEADEDASPKTCREYSPCQNRRQALLALTKRAVELVSWWSCCLLWRSRSPEWPSRVPRLAPLPRCDWSSAAGRRNYRGWKLGLHHHGRELFPESRARVAVLS